MAKQTTEEPPAKVLGKFEGRDVVTSSIALTNAGDGLSRAMEVDPVELKLGDKVYIVIEAEVATIKHAAMKDLPRYASRVHVLKAGVATLVDGQLVANVLDEQRKKDDAHKGVTALPFENDADGDRPDSDEAWEGSARKGGDPVTLPDAINEVAARARKKSQAAADKATAAAAEGGE